jgi:hypothetical protein
MTDDDTPLGMNDDGELNVVEEGSARQEPVIVDDEGNVIDPFLLDDEDFDDEDDELLDSMSADEARAFLRDQRNEKLAAMARDAQIADEARRRQQEQERHDLAMEIGRKQLTAADSANNVMVDAFDKLSAHIEESNRIARAPRKLVRDKDNRPDSAVVDLGDGQ